MKIAFASFGDPNSVTTWSGIPAHIIPELEKNGHEVIPIALRNPKEPWYYNWLRRWYYRTQNKIFASAFEANRLKILGLKLDYEVAKISPDVVLVIHADYLAYTTFKEPACIIHDATFASLVNYYSQFTGLSKRSIDAGNNMYKRALENCDAVVYSADWASNSAIKDYQTPVNKVFTIPLGANLFQPPSYNEVKKWISNRKNSAFCQFLFLGVIWERKGGPDALKFVAALNEMGINSRLVIVGCTPVINKEYSDFVEVIDFLNKEIPSDAERLQLLLKESNALLLPSLAECYGCVYCEANAYGLPALGRDTGGIPEIIKDGVNGLLLGVNETPEKFAERWAMVWNENGQYEKMSFSARTEFEERLNYTVFAKKIDVVLGNLVAKSKRVNQNS